MLRWHPAAKNEGVLQCLREGDKAFAAIDHLHVTPARKQQAEVEQTLLQHRPSHGDRLALEQREIGDPKYPGPALRSSCLVDLWLPPGCTGGHKVGTYRDGPMRWLMPIASAALALAPTTALAHGGGLDANGSHTNKKTGDYHCHGGGSQSPSQKQCSLNISVSRKIFSRLTATG